MKNFYENSEMEIVLFATEDIIATSAFADKVVEDTMGNMGGLM